MPNKWLVPPVDALPLGIPTVILEASPVVPDLKENLWLSLL